MVQYHAVVAKRIAIAPSRIKQHMITHSTAREYVKKSVVRCLINKDGKLDPKLQNVSCTYGVYMYLEFVGLF